MTKEHEKWSYIHTYKCICECIAASKEGTGDQGPGCGMPEGGLPKGTYHSFIFARTIYSCVSSVITVR